MLEAQPGQLGFGFLPGLDVHEIRQSVPEPADHRDMAGADVTVALRLSGGRQHRLQWLAVESAPLTQIGGFVDAP